MLTTKQAIAIGKRGGRARTRNLSPEKRSEIASWAHFIREQKQRGETTLAEQRGRFIRLVQVHDPDLAALLNFLSRLTTKRAFTMYMALPTEERAFIERLGYELLGGEDHG
jgi:hypothetical protein